MGKRIIASVLAVALSFLSHPSAAMARQAVPTARPAAPAPAITPKQSLALRRLQARLGADTALTARQSFYEVGFSGFQFDPSIPRLADPKKLFANTNGAVRTAILRCRLAGCNARGTAARRVLGILVREWEVLEVAQGKAKKHKPSEIFSRYPASEKYFTGFPGGSIRPSVYFFNPRCLWIQENLLRRTVDNWIANPRLAFTKENNSRVDQLRSLRAEIKYVRAEIACGSSLDDAFSNPPFNMRADSLTTPYGIRLKLIRKIGPGSLRRYDLFCIMKHMPVAAAGTQTQFADQRAHFGIRACENAGCLKGSPAIRDAFFRCCAAFSTTNRFLSRYYHIRGAGPFFTHVIVDPTDIPGEPGAHYVIGADDNAPLIPEYSDILWEKSSPKLETIRGMARKITNWRESALLALHEIGEASASVAEAEKGKKPRALPHATAPQKGN